MMNNNYLKAVTIGLAAIILMSSVHVATANEALLELACFNNEYCQELYGNNETQAVCVNALCQCKQLSNGEVIDCMPLESKLTNIISGACPCIVKHSECRKGTCYCAENFTASSDRRRCLPNKQNLNQICEMHSQCGLKDSFSICAPDSHVCTCQDSIEAEGKCASLVEQIACDNNKTCADLDPHMYCAVDPKICICAEEYVHTFAANKAACLTVANFNKDCNTDVQCQQKLGLAAKCSDEKICVCSENHAVRILHADSEQMRCEPFIKEGEYCRNDADCHQIQTNTTDKSMYCFHAACKCHDDYIKQIDGMCKLKSNNGGRLFKTFYLIALMQTLFIICL